MTYLVVVAKEGVEEGRVGEGSEGGLFEVQVFHAQFLFEDTQVAVLGGTTAGKD